MCGGGNEQYKRIMTEGDQMFSSKSLTDFTRKNANRQSKQSQRSLTAIFCAAALCTIAPHLALAGSPFQNGSAFQTGPGGPNYAKQNLYAPTQPIVRTPAQQQPKSPQQPGYKSQGSSPGNSGYHTCDSPVWCGVH